MSCSTVKGKGKHSRYGRYGLSSQPNDIDRETWDFIVENPLPSTLMWRSYTQVKAMFEGGTVEEDRPSRSAQEDPYSGSAAPGLDDQV